MSAIGGLASAFGGSSQSKEQRRLFQFQSGIANRLNQFSQSIPGSSPQEIAALASQRGLLGEQQRQDRQGLMSAMDLNQLSGSAPDALANISNQQTGQQSALTAQHLLQALNNRRDAMGQAAQVAGSAYGMAPQGGAGMAGLGQSLGGLAQMLAYMRALNKPGQVQGVPSPGGGYAGLGTTPESLARMSQGQAGMMPGRYSSGR
jgi:hypothetical protein